MELKTIEFKASEVDQEAGTFKGYAATWDLDNGDDVILKGAFTNTLMTKADQVKILWQHNSNQPIGKPTLMKEDERGLYIEGKISDTSLGKDAQILLKDEVIDRMSIGFSIPAKGAEMKDGIRYIKEIELFEFSLVTWPMNDAAVIEAVKSMPRQAEGIIRDVVNCSHKDAKTIVSKLKEGLRDVDSHSDKPNETESLLKELKSSIDSLLITTTLNN